MCVCVLISLDMSVGGRNVKWLSTTLGKPQGGATRGGEMLKVPSRLPIVFYLYMFHSAHFLCVTIPLIRPR